MRTTKQFRTHILKIAKEHGGKFFQDLEAVPVGAELRLSLGKSFDYLVIWREYPNTISVAHRSRDGRIQTDPRIVFWTGFGKEGWVPVEITQTFGGTRKVARYTSDELTHFNMRGISEVVTFANQWGRSIKEQGWLKDAKLTGLEVGDPKILLSMVSIPKPAKRRVGLKEITFHWSESSADNNFPMVAKTWEESDAILHSLAQNISAGDTSYYKTKFTVEWEDGETDSGRYDLRWGDQEFYGLLCRHIVQSLTFWGGVRCPGHMTLRAYAHLLVSVGEGPSQDCLDFLAAYEFGDGRAWGEEPCEKGERAIKKLISY